MADFEVIPQRSIDHLIANPTTASQFDSVFGEGRSAKIIAAQDPSPEPVELSEEDENWSVIGEATRAVVGGARDAFNETLNFSQWVDTEVNDAIFGEGRVLTMSGVVDREDTQFTFGDGGVYETPDVADNKTVVGGVARGITQFAAGYATFSKLTKLKGLKGAFVNGALADAIVFDPDDPNVTTMLGEFGVNTGALGELLATEPDDPEWANRLRNASEGVLIGGVVESLFWGARAVKATKAGDAKGAKEATDKQKEALKELDAGIDEVAGEVRVDIDETLKAEKTLFADKVAEKGSEAGERVRARNDEEGDLLDYLEGEADYVDNAKPREGWVPNPLPVIKDKQTRLELVILNSKVAGARAADAGTKGVMKVSDLTTSQVDVSPKVLSEQSGNSEAAVVVRRNGHNVVVDGNHYVARELEGGADEVNVNIIDLSDEKLDISDDLREALTDLVNPTKTDPVPTKGSNDGGQIEMDLGETPLPKPKNDVQVTNRIYLTPEKVEKIRLQSSLAKGHPNNLKTEQLSIRSPRTQSSFEAVLDEMAGTTAVLADEFAKIKGGDVQRWATVRAQSAAQLRQIAKMTGEDVEAVIARFQTANGGDMTRLAAEIHTQSRVVLSIEQELQEMAKVIANAAAGKEFDLKRFPEFKDLDELRMAFNLNRELAANLLGGSGQFAHQHCPRNECYEDGKAGVTLVCER